jgi:hypothetical protein
VGGAANDAAAAAAAGRMAREGEAYKGAQAAPIGLNQAPAGGSRVGGLGGQGKASFGGPGSAGGGGKKGGGSGRGSGGGGRKQELQGQQTGKKLPLSLQSNAAAGQGKKK